MRRVIRYNAKMFPYVGPPSVVPIHVYVDGESHFIRSRQAWKKLHGLAAELDGMVHQPQSLQGYSFLSDSKGVIVDHRAHIFWDARCIPLSLLPFFTGMGLRLQRAIYFTSFTGPANELHSIKTKLRSMEFEPQVILEQKTLARQRENTLEQTGVIEKAKGVDIGLTVRLLEDAYRNIYEYCVLFTSDIDYLPVIEAV